MLRHTANRAVLTGLAASCVVVLIDWLGGLTRWWFPFAIAWIATRLSHHFGARIALRLARVMFVRQDLPAVLDDAGSSVMHSVPTEIEGSIPAPLFTTLLSSTASAAAEAGSAMPDLCVSDVMDRDFFAVFDHEMGPIICVHPDVLTTWDVTAMQTHFEWELRHARWETTFLGSAAAFALAVAVGLSLALV